MVDMMPPLVDSLGEWKMHLSISRNGSASPSQSYWSGAECVASSYGCRVESQGRTSNISAVEST